MISQAKLTRRMTAILAAVVLAFVALIPLLQNSIVHADELPNRKVTIDKAYVNATDVEFSFEFDTPGTEQEREGIVLRFCTAALGTCTTPTGMNVQTDTISWDSQANWPQNTTNFAEYTTNTADQGACTINTAPTNTLCFNRTAATVDAVGGTADVSFTISGITAPSSNDTVYVRITLYENGTFDSPAEPDRGVVAAAFVNQLTVSATVAEYLEFCVGSEDTNTTGNENDTCSDITGTTINLGTIPPGAVCVSRLETGNGDQDPDTATEWENPCENHDGRRGYAMVATNAANGVTISYYAEQDGTNTNTDKDGTLKVPGADCTSTIGDTTDRCIESVGPTAASITAGTEGFGMTVSAVDTSNGLLTTNVTRAADYDGDGATGTPDIDCTGADDACWAWQQDGSPVQIASSPSVVDDEMLVLRFAAAATLTTPTGTYSVTSTYIATPTY